MCGDGRVANQSLDLDLQSYLLRFGGTGGPGARRVQSYLLRRCLEV